MLHLRLLGGAAVLASDGALTGAAGRRRALALLALVASSHDEGLARDRALALLWPELDSERARNNLKQLVFSLRRALSPEVFASTGAAIRLDPRVISVDLWAYHRALAEGALESAVARYGGPFLDGFSVPGLTEFERWVEAERERLAGIHAETLETLGEKARRAGQFEIAVAWRRHLAALDPLDTRHALSFMRALADAGDVAGALRHAYLFERLVRSELDTDVGPEIRLAVAQLRLRHEKTNARAVSSDELAILTTEMRAAKASQSASEEDGSGTEPASPTGSHAGVRGRVGRVFGKLASRVRVRHVAIMALAMANVLVLGFAGRTRFLSPSAALGEVAPDAPATVAVFAFDGLAGTLTGELGRAAAELLATSLDGGTGLTAVAARSDEQPAVRVLAGDSVVIDRASAARRAERLGARLFVLGRMVEVGGRFRVIATMYDRTRTDAPFARATAEGSPSEMFEVVDRLASQLLAGRFQGVRGELAQVAATTAASLPAAKAYYAAEQQLVGARFSAALDQLRNAVRLDTAFAIAYYRMGHVAELMGDDAEVRSAAASAARFTGRVDDHTRRLVLAAAARQNGDVASAERAYARLTLDYPEDAEAWFGLGETLFHLNPMRGRPAQDARDAFTRVIGLDPSHVEALVHLARIEVLRDDSAGAAQLVQRASTLATDEIIERLALHVRGFGGVSASGTVDRQRLQRASTLRRGPKAAAILSGRGPEAAERYAAQLVGPEVPPDVGAYGRRLAAYAASAHGRYADAMGQLDQARASDPDADVEVRSLIVASVPVPLDRAVVAQVRAEVEQWQPSSLHDPDQSLDAAAHNRAHVPLRLHRLGLLALRERDTVAAGRAAARLMAIGEPDSETSPAARALASSLRARIAAMGGDSARALAVLEQVQWAQAGRAAAVEPLDRLLRADLLAAAGRSAEAMRWYATLGTGTPQELPLVGFAALGMARISDRLGDRETALREYRRVVELWRGADPVLRPAMALAERRIADLGSSR